MPWFSFCLWMIAGQNAAAEIARIEKAAAGKPVQLLVPAVSSYTNINAPAELFDAPSGKSLVKVPRGLPAFAMETRPDGWTRVVVLSPFVLEAWAPPKGLALIINANTPFYASPNDSEARGMLSQGVMVRIEKRSGDMVQVNVHHHLPLRVWVPAARVGVKFENVPAVNFRYSSRWNRNVFECSPGPLYADKNSSVVVAELLDKGHFKKESEKGDWVEIASASDYDIRFKAWVPAKRMGTQSQYYYQYQYSFRVPQIPLGSWFSGSFRLTRPMAAQLQPDSASRLYLRAKTPIDSIRKHRENLYHVTFSRRFVYYRPTLSFLLNALESEPAENALNPYASSYDPQFILNVWMPLTLADVTIDPTQP